MTWKSLMARWTGKGGDAAPPPPDRPAPMTAESGPEAAVRDALRTVLDPEIGLNIVDLGLVYAIDATGERVRADITLTTPTCPLSESVADEARSAIRQALPDRGEPEIRMVWDPPWKPAMMSDDARKQLGW